jgi:serine/threonine-protein phosphatase 2A activator
MRFRPLRQIELPILQGIPELKIRSDQDVEVWKSTRGYEDYLLFLHRLSESVVGYMLPPANIPKQSQVCNRDCIAVV